MKKCPQCKLEYFDNMLEFCLDDGVRLVNPAPNERVAATVENPGSTTEKTVFIPPPTEVETAQFRAPQVPENRQPQNAENFAGSESVNKEKSRQILETAPIVISLAHNWWQWIYLENQYYSSLAAYVLSANFLMWLLLLLIGVTVSLFSLRNSRHKGFTYAALVILAVNLLLFIVPRK